MGVKINAHKRRILVNNLATKDHDEAFHNCHNIRIFSQSRGLVCSNNQETDNSIKLQRVVSKITVSDICIPSNYKTEYISEFAALNDTNAPENNSYNSNIYEDDLIVNT